MAQVGLKPVVNPPRAIVRLRDGNHVFDWNRGIMMVKMLGTRRRSAWMIGLMAYGPWALAFLGLFLAAGGVA